MKLNTTYPLKDMLKALTVASDRPLDLFKDLRKKSDLHTAFGYIYETEGMLTSSPFARVTLTRKVSDSRWEGYLETSLYADGPKTPCTVNRTELEVIANDNFTGYIYTIGDTTVTVTPYIK